VPVPTPTDSDLGGPHPDHDRQEALRGLRGTATEPWGGGGVPMVLALVDHRTGVPRPVPAADQSLRADGARTADEVDRLASLLLPDGHRPDARTTHVLHAEASRTTFALGDARPVPADTPVPTAPLPSAAGVPGPEVQRSALRVGSALRVANYHLTPETGRDALRSDLEGLARSFSTVGLEHLDSFFDAGDWGTPRPPVAPVFYEGYASSARVAAQVCDELGLTAWFAVCTGFLDCPEPSQEVYARAHWIDLHDSELDGRRLAMTWDDVRALSERHLVFPHTASHAGIADVVTDDDLEAEVREPLRRVREVTGRDAAVHAWFLGTAYGASPRHDEALVAAGHRYVVSNTMVQRIA
jgi:hypothetical protein